MFFESDFETNPRDYALELVEQGTVTADHLALICLKYMSHDDVRGMLENNELSPRFDEEEEEEIEYEFEDETDVRDAFWEEHDEYISDYSADKSQNDYSAEIRTAFVDWLDNSHREGRLSDELAETVTL